MKCDSMSVTWYLRCLKFTPFPPPTNHNNSTTHNPRVYHPNSNVQNISRIEYHFRKVISCHSHSLRWKAEATYFWQIFHILCGWKGGSERNSAWGVAGSVSALFMLPHPLPSLFQEKCWEECNGFRAVLTLHTALSLFQWETYWTQHGGQRQQQMTSRQACQEFQSVSSSLGLPGNFRNRLPDLEIF